MNHHNQLQDKENFSQFFCQVRLPPILFQHPHQFFLIKKQLHLRKIFSLQEENLKHMKDASNSRDPIKPQVIMSRVTTREQHKNRSFDIEFWREVGDAGRFAAAWQMIREIQLMRGQSGELSPMQKNVTRVIRRFRGINPNEGAGE